MGGVIIRCEAHKRDERKFQHAITSRHVASSEKTFRSASKKQPSERSRHKPAARCGTYRRDMDNLKASLGHLPVELRALVLSHIEQVKTRQILVLSSTFREAFSLPGALPRTFDFEGVAGDVIADCLVRLLDNDRVRSLDKERVLELIGDDKDRLCEYACGRNFEVLKWAHNELKLPWAPYPAGRVSDDVLVLRVLRESSSPRGRRWREDVGPEGWRGVKMVDGRVVELGLGPRAWNFHSLGLCAVPAEIGQLTSLKLSLIHI